MIDQPLIIIIGLTILILLSVIVLYIIKDKKTLKYNINNINRDDLLCNDNFDLAFNDGVFNISLEKMLPKVLDKKPKNNSLVRIDDKQLAAEVDNYFSNTVKVAHNVNVANKVANLSNNLVQVNIPVNELHHINSEQVRFFVQENGKIAKNAIGTPIDLSKVQTVNMVNAAMGVGSMVVGQYYLKTISDKMEGLEHNVDKISSFQDEEYKSEVLNIISSIQEMTKFKYEIMKNDTIRNNKIHELSKKKDDCRILLGQANIHIFKTLINCKDLKDYESKTNDIKEWLEFQQILIIALQEIATLEYAFYLGKMSRELCINTYSEFTNDTNVTNKALIKWHNEQQDILNIDIDKGLKQRDGIKPFWKLIKKEYKEVDKQILYLIKQQMNVDLPTIKDKIDRFKTNVTVIKDGNEYYYLLEDNE